MPDQDLVKKKLFFWSLWLMSLLTALADLLPCSSWVTKNQWGMYETRQ